jgi:RhtB (resistance to homoserine/threonine) family protein
VHIDLAPFLAISILLILIPGPDTAVVTKNALLGARRPGVAAAVGVSLGLVVWTVAAALGIATLLRASSFAFDILKVVGALYLAWIGVQMLRSRGAVAEPSVRIAGRGHSARAVRQGLLTDLGNPKIAVFFTSFLPQFIHGGGSAVGSLLVLGGIFTVLTFAWLAAYSLLVGRASDLIRKPRVRKSLDRFTGVVLIGFAVKLAFEHR